MTCVARLLRAPRQEITLRVSVPLAALWVLSLWPGRFAGAAWVEGVLAAAVFASGDRIFQGWTSLLAGRPRRLADALGGVAAMAAFAVSFLLAALHACGKLPAYLADSRGGPLSLYAPAATIVAARVLAHRVCPLPPRLPGADRATPQADGESRRRGAGAWILLLAAGSLALAVPAAGGNVVAATSAVVAVLAAASLESARLVEAGFATLVAAIRKNLAPGVRASEVRSAAAVRAVLFERRGVLTLGCPRVSAVHAIADSTDEDEVLQLAAMAEYPVRHALRDAIVESYSMLSRTMPTFTGVEAVGDCGVRTTYRGEDLLVGNLRLLDGAGCFGDRLEQLGKTQEALSSRGETVIFVALGDKVQGAICIDDPLRRGAEETFEALADLGVKPGLVSGDDAAPVLALARRLAALEVHAGIEAAGMRRRLETLPRERPARAVVREAGNGQGGAGDPAAGALELRWTGGPDGGIPVAPGDLPAVARFLKSARRAVRTRRRCAFLVLAYHALALPLVSGALAVPLGVAPLPVVAAISGAALPAFLRCWLARNHPA